VPKIDRLRRDAARELVTAQVRAPDTIVVHLELSIHAKNDTGKPCPHCQSDHAIETRRERIDTKLIDLDSGESFFRSKVDPVDFDDAAAGELTCTILIPCTESTRAHLTDYHVNKDGQRRSTLTIFSGGVRSGKTSEDAGEAAVDIFYMGGPGEQGWLGGPTIGHAHIFKKKLIDGEGQMPALLPREFVLSAPRSDRDTDQTAYLIDGTELKFKHCRSVDEWQGEAPFMSRITEAGNVKDGKILMEAEARVTDRQGRAGFDSIPVMPSPLYESYLQGKRDIEDNGSEATTRILEMSSADNPWQPPGEMATKRAKAAKLDPQQARRMYDGVWASDNSLLFEDVWDETDGTFDTYFQDHRQIAKALIEIGKAKIGRPLVDVTKTACRRFFHKPHEWVIGADANFEPHTALICKIVAFGSPEDQSRWGLLVWDEVRTWRASTFDAAERLSEVGGGYLKGQGVSLDASEDYDKKIPGGHRKMATGVQDYKAFGFNCKPCNKTDKGFAKNPDVKISTNLVKHLLRENLMLINGSQCQGLVRALNEQEDRGDGRPKDPAKSNTITDREIYAFTDALRYITVPMFGKIVEKKLVGSQARVQFT